jgi:hypothetical protein
MLRDSKPAVALDVLARNYSRVARYHSTQRGGVNDLIRRGIFDPATAVSGISPYLAIHQRQASTIATLHTYVVCSTCLATVTEHIHLDEPMYLETCQFTKNTIVTMHEALRLHGLPILRLVTAIS